MNDRFFHFFHLRSYFGGCLELVSLDGWGLSFLSMNFYLFELKYDHSRYRCICEVAKARKHCFTCSERAESDCITDFQGTNLEGIEL